MHLGWEGDSSAIQAPQTRLLGGGCCGGGDGRGFDGTMKRRTRTDMKQGSAKWKYRYSSKPVTTPSTTNNTIHNNDVCSSTVPAPGRPPRSKPALSPPPEPRLWNPRGTPSCRETFAMNNLSWKNDLVISMLNAQYGLGKKRNTTTHTHTHIAGYLPLVPPHSSGFSLVAEQPTRPVNTRDDTTRTATHERTREPNK